jgi:hypothetical protein
VLKIYSTELKNTEAVIGGNFSLVMLKIFYHFAPLVGWKWFDIKRRKIFQKHLTQLLRMNKR